MLNKFKKLIIVLTTAFVLVSGFSIAAFAEESPRQLSKNYSFGNNDYNSATISSLYTDLDNLPSSFSLADSINFTVENQGYFNVCEDFAGLKIVETNHFLKTGEYINLSERWVDYILSNKLYGYRNIGTYAGRDSGDGIYLQEVLLAAETFGVPKEEDFPFAQDYEALDILNYTPALTLNSAVVFPRINQLSDTQKEGWLKVIKSHVKNYSALRIGVSGTFPNNDIVYSPEVELLGAPTVSGHAVTIVGYDDNYAASNFADSSITKDGAFYCLNSWGPNWGNNGYFWLSYYSDSLIRAYGALDTSIGKVYKHPANASTLFPNPLFNSQSTNANYGFKFNDKSYKNYQLSRIMMGFGSNNASIDADKFIVYVNPTDDSFDADKLIPVSVEKSIVAGAAASSVILDEPITIQGDSFAVVIRPIYTTGGNSFLYSPTETLSDSSFKAFRQLNGSDEQWDSMNNSFAVSAALLAPESAEYLMKVRFVDLDNENENLYSADYFAIATSEPSINLETNEEVQSIIEGIEENNYVLDTVLPTNLASDAEEFTVNFKHKTSSTTEQVTFTRTIKFKDASTNELIDASAQQSVTIPKTTVTDLVTNTVISTDLYEEYFAEYNLETSGLELPDYDLEGVVVSSEIANGDKEVIVSLQPVDPVLPPALIAYKVVFYDSTREKTVKEFQFVSPDQEITLRNYEDYVTEIEDLLSKHYLIVEEPVSVNSSETTATVILEHDVRSETTTDVKTYTRTIKFVDAETGNSIADDNIATVTTRSNTTNFISLVDGEGAGAMSNLHIEPVGGFPPFEVPEVIGEYKTSPRTIVSESLGFKDETYTIEYTKDPVAPNTIYTRVDFVDDVNSLMRFDLSELSIQISGEEGSAFPMSEIEDTISMFAQHHLLPKEENLNLPEVLDENTQPQYTITLIHETSPAQETNYSNSLVVNIINALPNGQEISTDASIVTTRIRNELEISSKDLALDINLATESKSYNEEKITITPKHIEGYKCLSEPHVIEKETYLFGSVSTAPIVPSELISFPLNKEELLGAIMPTKSLEPVVFIYEPLGNPVEKIVNVTFEDVNETEPQDLSEFAKTYTISENEELSLSEVKATLETLKTNGYAVKSLDNFDELPDSVSFEEASDLVIELTHEYQISSMFQYGKADLLVKVVSDDGFYDSSQSFKDYFQGDLVTYSALVDAVTKTVLQEPSREFIVDDDYTIRPPVLSFPRYYPLEKPIVIPSGSNIEPYLNNGVYEVTFHFTADPITFTIIENFINTDTGEDFSDSIVREVTLKGNETFVLSDHYFDPSFANIVRIEKTPEEPWGDWQDGQTYIIDYYIEPAGQVIPVTISYEYAQNNLPEEVLATLPSDKALYLNSKVRDYKVFPEDPSTTEFVIDNVKYTFEGWEVEYLQPILSADALRTFYGNWSIEQLPVIYPIEKYAYYEFEGDLPQEVLALLPKPETYSINNNDFPYLIEPTGLSKDSVTVGDITYFFNGWDKDSFTFTEEGPGYVDFKGKWTAELKVKYIYNSEDGTPVYNQNGENIAIPPLYDTVVVENITKDYILMPSAPDSPGYYGVDGNWYKFGAWVPGILSPFEPGADLTFRASWSSIGTPPEPIKDFVVTFVDTDTENPIDLSQHTLSLNSNSLRNKEILDSKLSELLRQPGDTNLLGKFELVPGAEIPSEFPKDGSAVIRLRHIVLSKNPAFSEERDLIINLFDEEGNVLGTLDPIRVSVVSTGPSTSEDLTTGKTTETAPLKINISPLEDLTIDLPDFEGLTPDSETLELLAEQNITGISTFDATSDTVALDIIYKPTGSSENPGGTDTPVVPSNPTDPNNPSDPGTSEPKTACSAHGGIDCSKKDVDGSVYCKDGTKDSNFKYDDIKSCSGQPHAICKDGVVVTPAPQSNNTNNNNNTNSNTNNNSANSNTNNTTTQNQSQQSSNNNQASTAKADVKTGTGELVSMFIILNVVSLALLLIITRKTNLKTGA